MRENVWENVGMENHLKHVGSKYCESQLHWKHVGKRDYNTWSGEVWWILGPPLVHFDFTEHSYNLNKLKKVIQYGSK